MGQIQSLNDAVKSYHTDLTSREVEIMHGMVHDIMNNVIHQRESLALIFDAVAPILAFRQHLQSIASVVSHEDDKKYFAIASPDTIYHAVVERSALISQCIEQVVRLQAFDESQASGRKAIDLPTMKLSDLSDALSKQKEVLSDWVAQISRSRGLYLLLDLECRHRLKEAEQCIEQALDCFEAVKLQLAEISTDFSLLVNDIGDRYSHLNYEQQMEAETLPQFDQRPSDLLENTIKSLLVSFQDLLQKDTLERDEFGMFPNYLSTINESLRKWFTLNHLESIQTTLLSLCSSAQHQQIDIRSLCSILPFLDQYLSLFLHRLFEAIIQHKSTAKLSRIMCNTFMALLTKGLHLPESHSENDESSAEEAGGLGLADGEGTNDVTDTLDETNDLDDVKASNEPEDSAATQKNPEDKAIENGDDFNGELEDAPNEIEDNMDVNDENEGAEENMGELNGEGDVVDEKLWNPDDNDIREDPNEKTEKNSQNTNASEANEEIVAQDNPDSTPENESSKKKEEPKSNNGPPDAETDEFNEGDDEEDVINDNGLDSYEDNHGIVPKDVAPENELESEELPDSMNLDDDADGGSNDGNEPQFDPHKPELAEENSAEGEESAEPQFDDNEDSLEDGVRLEEMTTSDNEEEHLADDADDVERQGDAMEVDNEPDTSNIGVEENEKENTMTADSTQSAQAKMQEFTSEKNNSSAQSGGKMEQSLDSVGSSSDGDGSAEAENSQSVPMKSLSTDSILEKLFSEPNPLKSLGTALEAWEDRLKIVEESIRSSQDPTQLDIDVDIQADYQHIADGDENYDAQVMDTATHEQLKEFSKGSKMGAQEKHDPTLDKFNKQAKREQPDKKYADSEAFKSTHLPEALADEKVRKPKPDEPLEANGSESNDTPERLPQQKESGKRKEGEKKSAIELQNDESEMEDVLPTPFKEPAEMIKSLKAWDKYSQATQDLAFNLCESLRLILEPTLASKLKGDYQTGKRLNMRKIISYVASQYKKDKIWLRRTKLAKRSYQILLSIDDSKSMAESKSTDLAFESLALLSKALTLLEVGEMGVVCFGEKVDLVHAFNDPFSDESGNKMVDCFTFAQQKTDIRLLMDQANELLKNARMSASSGPTDLWQLHVIVSDGIMDDHNTIRDLVRQAIQERILIVFVVLDQRAERDSIMQMTNVTYRVDPKSGKSKLELSQYMETFPFEYYIVLKDIKELPSVLADTLRQYFMFVANS
ncbi:hypothetical protein HDV05_005496 [Chytridiales sp. JEL 0842]|nr:hypothetical protein HDV05_005496 [Chytridiales sp. JEL 0842]